MRLQHTIISIWFTFNFWFCSGLTLNWVLYSFKGLNREEAHLDVYKDKVASLITELACPGDIVQSDLIHLCVLSY